MLNDQLSVLADRRSRAQRDIDEAGLEIGAITSYLRDVLGQAKARSADFAGISPSHLTVLMQTAAEKGITVPDPLGRVPFLKGAELQAYVNARGGPQRVVASFAQSDTMYMAGISPASLLDPGFGVGIREASMLILTKDGGWVGVENVTVGYGGTGPSNAVRELNGLGLAPDLVNLIAYSRVTDVDLDQPEQALHTHQWPRIPMGTPWPVNDFFVSVVHVEDPAWRRSGPFGLPRWDPRPLTDNLEDQTSHGFYATPSSEPLLTSWLAALDSPTKPDWMTGPRRARVYLDRQLAQDHGFTRTTLQPRSHEYGVYPVIIEQGQLQLWLSIPTSNDPTVLFTPEIYSALDQSGFYTEDLQAKDSQGAFWRWIRSFGTQRPRLVDLDGLPLQHLPLGQDGSARRISRR